MDLTHIFEPDWLVTMAIIAFASIPVHEWAHAWAAYRLGDDTAARRGRLTLNPLAHMDPVGTLTLFLIGYGWGKPVPVVPYRLRGNRRLSRALVSVAGPFSNLVMAMLAAIPIRLRWVRFSGGDSPFSLLDILATFILVNLSLMIFNLIPFPPLDGSRILAWLLPPSLAGALEQLERVGGVGLLMVLFLLSRTGVLGWFLDPVLDFGLRALLRY